VAQGLVSAKGCKDGCCIGVVVVVIAVLAIERLVVLEVELDMKNVVAADDVHIVVDTYVDLILLKVFGHMPVA